MVNEEKLLIMAKIAIDEKELGQKTISEGGYYRSDYLRSHILSVMLNYSAAYALILILAALYNAEYIFLNFVSINYTTLFFEILLPYIFIMVLCVAVSYVYYANKYANDRIRIKEYYAELKRLEKFYEDGRKEAVDDRTFGIQRDDS